MIHPGCEADYSPVIRMRLRSFNKDLSGLDRIRDGNGTGRTQNVTNLASPICLSHQAFILSAAC